MYSNKWNICYLVILPYTDYIYYTHTIWSATRQELIKIRASFGFSSREFVDGRTSITCPEKTLHTV